MKLKSSDRESIFDSVYDLVKAIPAGKVATYGDIAKVLDINPRYVGYILHYNPDPGTIPCHRVVNSIGKTSGNFAFGGGLAQENLLKAEGICFKNNRLDLKKYRHVY